MSNSPLISCLCISNHRPGHLISAISKFRGQTYTNKELVIVSNEYSKEYQKIVRSCADSNIKYFPTSGTCTTLGDLRNSSIEHASGDYICIWDDDDWFHNQRLELQLHAALSNHKDGSILTYCLLYNAVNKAAYLSHPFNHPATILVKRSVLNNSVRYPSLNKAEDSVFVNKLYHINALYPLVNPVLYMYVYHSQNTWSIEHFDKLFSSSFRLPELPNSSVTNIYEDMYSYEEASALLVSEQFSKELNYFKIWAWVEQSTG